jgi:hypothetical protein
LFSGKSTPPSARGSGRARHKVAKPECPEIDALLATAESWTGGGTTVSFKDADRQQVDRRFFVHSRAVELPFAGDVVLPGNALRTNLFGARVGAANVEYWEGRSEFLDRAFLPDRTALSFEAFLEKIQEILRGSVELLVQLAARASS